MVLANLTLEHGIINRNSINRIIITGCKNVCNSLLAKAYHGNSCRVSPPFCTCKLSTKLTQRSHTLDR